MSSHNTCRSGCEPCQHPISNRSRNLPELQLEMGHRDATLLRSRYMAPALRREAARFWESWRE